jgi:hypothetical protein
MSTAWSTKLKAIQCCWRNFDITINKKPNAKFSGAGAKRRAPTAKLWASAATLPSHVFDVKNNK